MMSRLRWCLVFAGVLTGCGPTAPPPPTTYPTTGVVKFQGGRPFAGGIISLTSTSDPRVVMEATIEDDGSFQLGMMHDNRRLTGAQAGTYDVLLSSRFQPGQGVTTYHLPSGAVIRAETNVLTIELDPAKGKRQ